MQNKKVIIPIFIALIVVSGALIMTQIQLPRDRYNHTTQERPQNTNAPTATTGQPHYDFEITYTTKEYVGTLNHVEYDKNFDKHLKIWLDWELIDIPYGYVEGRDDKLVEDLLQNYGRNALVTVTYANQYYQGSVCNTWIDNVTVTSAS
jgi:hypothetical protein